MNVGELGVEQKMNVGWCCGSRMGLPAHHEGTSDAAVANAAEHENIQGDLTANLIQIHFSGLCCSSGVSSSLSLSDPSHPSHPSGASVLAGLCCPFWSLPSVLFLLVSSCFWLTLSSVFVSFRLAVAVFPALHLWGSPYLRVSVFDMFLFLSFRPSISHEFCHNCSFRPSRGTASSCPFHWRKCRACEDVPRNWARSCEPGATRHGGDFAGPWHGCLGGRSSEGQS